MYIVTLILSSSNDVFIKVCRYGIDSINVATRANLPAIARFLRSRNVSNATIYGMRRIYRMIRFCKECEGRASMLFGWYDNNSSFVKITCRICRDSEFVEDLKNFAKIVRDLVTELRKRIAEEAAKNPSILISERPINPEYIVGEEVWCDEHSGNCVYLAVGRRVTITLSTPAMPDRELVVYRDLASSNDVADLATVEALLKIGERLGKEAMLAVARKLSEKGVLKNIDAILAMENLE